MTERTVAGYGVLERHPASAERRILLGRGNVPFATERDAWEWGQLISQYNRSNGYHFVIVEIAEVARV